MSIRVDNPQHLKGPAGYNGRVPMTIEVEVDFIEGRPVAIDFAKIGYTVSVAGNVTSVLRTRV